MKLSILTLNTWAIPVPMPQLRKRERLARIRDGIARLEPDVVLLQELFHPRSREGLLEALAPDLRAGPTASGVRSSWGVAWDRTGGLVSLSRHEIVDEEFHPHDLTPRLRFDERLARKGTLVSRLRIGSREVVVANAHLHSGARRRDVANRGRQTDKLRGLLHAAGTGAPVIVGGDFNERSRFPGSSRSNGNESLAAIGFRDLWGDLDEHPRPTYDAQRNPYARSWYNYTRVPAPFDRILVRDGDDVAVRVREARVVFGRSGELVSDHFGLLTVLEVGDLRWRDVEEISLPARALTGVRIARHH